MIKDIIFAEYSGKSQKFLLLHDECFMMLGKGYLVRSILIFDIRILLCFLLRTCWKTCSVKPQNIIAQQKRKIGQAIVKIALLWKPYHIAHMGLFCVPSIIWHKSKIIPVELLRAEQVALYVLTIHLNACYNNVILHMFCYNSSLKSWRFYHLVHSISELH